MAILKLIPTTPRLDYAMAAIRKIDAFPGVEGEKQRQGIADDIMNNWDAVDAKYPKYIEVYRHNIAYNCPKIRALFSGDFCVEHNFCMTREQLVKGPKHGKTWYIRANLFPLSLLPGLPYIYIPGVPIYPLFRITNKPL